MKTSNLLRFSFHPFFLSQLEHIRDGLEAAIDLDKQIIGTNESKAKNLRKELERLESEHDQQMVKVRAKYVCFNSFP